jgi:hypothetical protein
MCRLRCCNENRGVGNCLLLPQECPVLRPLHYMLDAPINSVAHNQSAHSQNKTSWLMSRPNRNCNLQPLHFLQQLLLMEAFWPHIVPADSFNPRPFCGKSWPQNEFLIFWAMVMEPNLEMWFMLVTIFSTLLKLEAFIFIAIKSWTTTYATSRWLETKLCILLSRETTYITL